MKTISVDIRYEIRAALAKLERFDPGDPEYYGIVFDLSDKLTDWIYESMDE